MHYWFNNADNFMMLGSFWMIGIMVVRFVLVVIVIYFGIKLIKKYLDNNESKTKEDAAMRILRERYAKGEIDADEFKRRKEELDNYK